MKNLVFATLSSLTLLAVPAAFAQNSTALRADIPFEFRVGTKTLPAGQYYVRAEAPRGYVTIHCFSCKVGMAIMTFAASRNTSREGKLVFSRYGNSHFLSSVWAPGDAQGRELPKSKVEREFVSSNAPAGVTTVALALR
jgi:hypothetical protein